VTRELPTTIRTSRGSAARAALLALLSFSCSEACRAAPAAPPEPQVSLKAEPIPLDPSDPSRVEVGGLRYRGGLWLRSEDRRFGGLSDLRVSPDGSRLWAISDCGGLFTARLGYDERGTLSEISRPEIRPLGSGLTRPDAEAFVSDGAGGWIVAFEGKARLFQFPSDGSSGPRPLELPAVLARADDNNGVEAMARLADGRLLLLKESTQGEEARTGGWLGAGRDWQPLWFPLFFAPGGSRTPFYPTSAAPLADGGLLVLERRYPPVAARLRRIAAADLAAGRLEGTEVAYIGSPLSVDNMEGVETRPGADGATLVYVLSDDNDCAKTALSIRKGAQRTLLMMFELRPAAPAAGASAGPATGPAR
jgi:hypothetical protein